MNRGVGETEEGDFLSDKSGPAVSLAEALEITDDGQFAARFAGSPLMRARRIGLVRNACIAAANTGDDSLVQTLEFLSKSSDNVILEHARWALATLKGSHSIN